MGIGGQARQPLVRRSRGRALAGDSADALLRLRQHARRQRVHGVPAVRHRRGGAGEQGPAGNPPGGEHADARTAARRGPGARPRARHPHAVARADRDSPAADRQVRGESVATGPDRGADARHAACAAIARTAGNGTRTLSVVRQSEIVAIPALGPGVDAEQLCDRLQTVRENLLGEGIALAMGVSTVIAGTAQIPQAYQEARTVLEFLPEEEGWRPCRGSRPSSIWR
ncbi:hypothetical protein ACFQX6_18310 [Streptosporangium lutulentum]